MLTSSDFGFGVGLVVLSLVICFTIVGEIFSIAFDVYQ